MIPAINLKIELFAIAESANHSFKLEIVDSCLIYKQSLGETLYIQSFISFNLGYMQSKNQVIKMQLLFSNF